MNSDQELAKAASVAIGALVTIAAVTTLQAYLLTLILPWLFAGISLGLGQAFIIVFFIKLFF